jgi:superoxide dismutase, Fe-Mn family
MSGQKLLANWRIRDTRFCAWPNSSPRSGRLEPLECGYPYAMTEHQSIPYSLPELAYELDALEPVVSSEIMDLHYNKHHATYVKAANTALEQMDALAADEDPSALLRSLSFNVGGHALHSLFWSSMSPAAGPPSSVLGNEISRSFGSMDVLKARMTQTLAKLSGSGWAALCWEPVARRLVVSQIHDHQSEMIAGAFPLLVIDGWEHAYYLDYKSDRAGWAEKFFEVADWEHASARFVEVASLAGTSAS